VACEASGITVLDIDSKSGADPREVLDALDVAGATITHTGEAPEPTPDRPRSLAGVRGAQVIFRGKLLTTDKLKIPGTEIRGAGAYIVAPPSVHPSSVQYSGELPPVDRLRAVPAWLPELIPRAIVATGSPLIPG
jgi:hypothetical protein